MLMEKRKGMSPLQLEAAPTTLGLTVLTRLDRKNQRKDRGGTLLKQTKRGCLATLKREEQTSSANIESPVWGLPVTLGTGKL